jgi:hypothetical protein
MEHRFEIEILNKSEVVKELQQLGAEFSYFNTGRTQLVIADSKIGLMMKLKYG